jgi:hypothetical protein
MSAFMKPCPELRKHEFKRLANKVVEWPQSAFIGTFLGGLRDEIADEVCMAKPQTL